MLQALSARVIRRQVNHIFYLHKNRFRQSCSMSLRHVERHGTVTDLKKIPTSNLVGQVLQTEAIGLAEPVVLHVSKSIPPFQLLQAFGCRHAMLCSGGQPQGAHIHSSGQRARR